ncbi:helix-turn-helix domain-containing protein [Nucisporomicrobium flavum]|uniref:helix-turn-helix domain-containing protein n=1 Tax=Nucisporomicrobium flavum TaxID=2785915 RepID=UPI003C308A9F
MTAKPEAVTPRGVTPSAGRDAGVPVEDLTFTGLHESGGRMTTALTPQPDVGSRADPAQEYLGRQLRRLREASGISRETAGRHIGSSEPKISRIELGRTRVKDRDLHDLLTLYGVTDEVSREAILGLASKLNQPQWWHDYGDVVSGWLRSYLVLESFTDKIRTYESRFIPGLLQTTAYAQALVKHHYQNEDEVRRRVEVRQRRRQTLLDPRRLTRAPNGVIEPWLWAIIDEPALHERIGSAAVMREQIDFLIHATRNLHVRIQILPAGTAGLTGVGNSFSLLRLHTQELPDVVYLEHLAGAHFLYDPHEVDPYRLATERIGITALHPSDTVTELEKAKRRLAVRF